MFRKLTESNTGTILYILGILGFWILLGFAMSKGAQELKDIRQEIREIHQRVVVVNPGKYVVIATPEK